MNNQLFIIRGLPGSGKSTLAAIIAHRVAEADMYFMKEGVYQFDATKLQEAHAQCTARVKDAMEEQIPTIAVANTFVRRWEMMPYYALAWLNGYDVTEITLAGQLYKNVHGVPDEVIERMRGNWEK